jgi:ATP-binding cassette subfamily B protein
VTTTNWIQRCIRRSFMRFRFYKQLNKKDCGPTCLRMVSQFYGKHYHSAKIAHDAGYSKSGVSFLGLSYAAEILGFRTRCVQISTEQLLKHALLPCIVHWDHNHFIVLPPQKLVQRISGRILIADPAKGLSTLSHEDFLSHWITTNTESGVGVGTVLLLEPTPKFYEQVGEESKDLSWVSVLRHLKGSNWTVVQIISTLIFTSVLQLIFPFLTQSLVDKGIDGRNLNYVSIVLIAQFVLISSRSIVEFLRISLLTRMSIKLNFALLSDFWLKITKLPISYFESYHTGDTLQRLGDTKRIEAFLTGNALTTFFSLFNFAIFATVLIIFNGVLFFVFVTGSLLYLLWVRVFLKYRRKFNYQAFSLSAKENDLSLQLIDGMRDLKLNGAEKQKRWEWESVQASIFNLNLKTLSLSQIQQAGALFLNEGKNLVITFVVAKMVIDGSLTFGAMLAIQYITGQLNGPIEQFVSFVQTAQDAKISLERLNDIHQLKDEEAVFQNTQPLVASTLPLNKSIVLKNLTYAYPGVGNVPVLKNISIDILGGKTTAIVGVSGSGKTTLLKILLRFYESYEGDIHFAGSQTHGDMGDGLGSSFRSLSQSLWRSHCGSVLQDGYIFGDTIAANITLGDNDVNYERLIHACKMANVLQFVESFPNGFDTKIGSNGSGLSQGQKQRLFIARAIYKNAPYLFFDEATNSLDANNEKDIVENLQNFSAGKTLVIIAHRLSTVKNADNIVVLHNGEVAEQGTHDSLIKKQGRYFELVKNQLELGD